MMSSTYVTLNKKILLAFEYRHINRLAIFRSAQIINEIAHAAFCCLPSLMLPLRKWNGNCGWPFLAESAASPCHAD